MPLHPCLHGVSFGEEGRRENGCGRGGRGEEGGRRKEKPVGGRESCSGSGEGGRGEEESERGGAGLGRGEERKWRRQIELEGRSGGKGEGGRGEGWRGRGVRWEGGDREGERRWENKVRDGGQT